MPAHARLKHKLGVGFGLSSLYLCQVSWQDPDSFFRWSMLCLLRWPCRWQRNTAIPSHGEAVTRPRYGQLFLPQCSLPRFPVVVCALCKWGSCWGALTCTTASKTQCGAFCRHDIYHARDCSHLGMGSDIQKHVTGCQMWGDAVWDMMRGTQDLPLQQGSRGQEETPSKGVGQACPTALQPWER